MPQSSIGKEWGEPDSPAPRFRQIVDRLRHEIIGGGLAEHAPLPSERAIAELHGVSRMTARRALEAVEAEGLAYSEERRGRFVSPQRLNYNVSSMANFVADAEADGIGLEIRVVENGSMPASAKLAKTLSVEEGGELLVTTRLFLTKGHAIFVETEHVVPELGWALAGAAANKSPHRFSPFGHSADIVIRMRAIEPGEAELLGTSPHQAGIEQEQVSRDRAGTAFCYTTQIWRGELAQFSAKAIVNR